VTALGRTREANAMAPKTPRPLPQRKMVVAEFQKTWRGTVTRVKLMAIKPNHYAAASWSWRQYEIMTERLGYRAVAGHCTKLWPRKRRERRGSEIAGAVSR